MKVGRFEEVIAQMGLIVSVFGISYAVLAAILYTML